MPWQLCFPAGGGRLDQACICERIEAGVIMADKRDEDCGETDKRATAAHPAQHALVSFFENVARKDATQLKRLSEAPAFRIEQGRWYFTLPDLYAFLQQHDASFSDLDYKQFRRRLYTCPINQTLKALGAEVTVADNRTKVDESVYALVWRAP